VSNLNRRGLVMKKITALIIICIAFHTCLWGAYAENYPTTITQPDGTIVECFYTGEGNHNGKGFGGACDEVYVYRKDGSIFSDGNYREAYFSEATNRTIFSNYSNPYCFYTLNDCITPTAYDGNIYIKNIRENPDGTLSFDVRFCDDDNIVYSNTSYLPALTNASNSIKTINTVIVKSIDNVIFEAGNEVILNSGFGVQLGGTFEINMNECGDK
jgi:hypothetical protein